MAKQLDKLDGYVRCDRPHLSVRWLFEEVDPKRNTAIVTIETNDGAVEVALHRAAAQDLMQKLQLALADWPEDHPKN